MTLPDSTKTSEEIQRLKKKIVDLEKREATHKRSENLLNAFNQASLAISKSTTPEEIFDTVADSLKRLGFSSIIYSIDSEQQNLIINSITLNAQELESAEKITGFGAIGYKIPIDSVDIFRTAIREQKTTITREYEGIIREIMPARLKKLGVDFASMMEVSTSINAPLISGDEVIGLLSIQSKDFVENDIPLISSFAHQVASSWQKANLYQQTQQEAAVRKQVELRLENEHNLAQRYLDIAGVLIVVLNKHGDIELINQKGCEVLDYTTDELIGENWFEKIIPDKEREQVWTGFVLLMQGKLDSFEYFENPVQTKNGERRIIAWHNSLLTDDDGTITGTLSSGEDVTERLQAETALRESEERFRSIVQASPMGMHIYSLESDGRLIFKGSNPAADKILWVDNKRFIGKTIEEAFPALVDTEIPERYRRAAANGESWHNTQVNYEDQWISGIYEVYAVQTSPGNMAAIFLDISDQIRAQEEQRRLVNILEATSDVVATMTVSGQLVYLNSAGRRLLGLKDEENLKNNDRIQNLSVYEYLQIKPENLNAAKLYGIWSGESVIIDISNREIPVSIVLITHRDENRNPDYISAVIRDIGDLRHAEDLIYLQSTALNSAATGIFIADIQGKIIWANPAISEITGFGLTEIIGQTPEMFRADQQGEDTQQQILDILTQEAVWQGESVNRRKSGETYICEQTITPVFDNNGKVTHYISIQQDVSQRKKDERDLKQRATQLALLNEIGEQIVAVLDLERVFQQAVELVQGSFDYHHVGIFTVNPDDDKVQLRASAGGFKHLFPPDHALKIGQGIVGWTALNNQASLSNDVLTDSRFVNRFADQLPTRSELAVPIHIGDEVIGVLDAQSPSPDAFNDSDLTVLQTLADQIAIAVENARLHAAIKRTLEESKAMAAINHALNETLDLNRLLQLMVDSIGQIIPHLERVVAHLYDEENATLIPAAVTGVTSPETSHLQMRDGQGIAGEVIKTGESINVRDTDDDPRFIPIDGASHLRSLLVVPVQSGGRRLGTISVSSKIPRTFTNEDERLLTMIGVQAALAIESARLFEETQQRAQHLALLNDITRTALQQPDSQTILYTLADRIQKMYNADGCHITLWDNHRNAPVTAAAVGPLGNEHTSLATNPDDSALTKAVLSAGRALIVDEANLSEYMSDEIAKQFAERFVMALPLIAGNQHLGAVIIAYLDPHQFTTDEINLGESIAQQTALAISKAKLLEAERNRRQEAETLRDITAALTATLEIDQVLERILLQLEDAIPYDSAAVLLLEGEILTLVTGRGLEGFNIDIGQQLPLNTPLYQEIRSSRKAICIQDVLADDRWEDFDTEVPVRSWMGIPLIIQEELIGFLTIDNWKPDIYTEHELNLAQAFGNQASIALQNARLYAATRRRLTESNMLFYISNLIVDSVEPDVEAILDKVVNRLWKDFGYYHVHVYLIDQESGVLIANQGSGTIGTQLKEEEYQFTPEEGIVGYAASVGEAFMTNNVDNVHFFQPHPLLPDTSAELAVPLQARDQILGVLDILYQPPNTFDKDDFRFLTTVADQLAVVLDKAMLYNQLQEALQKEQNTRAQLVQTEKLAAMGRLIASVAHELNNPLQAIQNALYLVKMEENLSKQAEEDLQVAIDEGTRMAGLIARLRDTYRPIEATDYQPESVNTLVEEVRKLLGTHLRHNNVELEFIPTPDIPTAILIRDQIKQVILNLCINAIESMSQGGKLKITSNYKPETEEIQINVSDTGPGMTSEVQSRIFEPFFTTKERGTGLGLAVSYEIIQNHGGTITAVNNEKAGSTFTISLPCKQPMLE